MARLSDLVKVLAMTEGLDEVSVGIFARRAREAGLILQGGRGRSAARMTVRDAANLLIGVNASALAKDVPKVIKGYRNLVTLSNPAGERSLLRQAVSDSSLHREPSLVETICKKGSDFGSSLEMLIAACGSDSPQPLNLRSEMELVVDDEWFGGFFGIPADEYDKIAAAAKQHVRLEIEFNRPNPKATITLLSRYKSPRDDRQIRHGYEIVTTGQFLPAHEEDPNSRQTTPDRLDVTIITHATLFAVAAALAT
jgi:hypothetical protein